jgi:oligosaccharide repeat unit polymerase
MQREVVYVFLFINLLVAIVYYLNKKCEIPLFIALFNIMVEYRILSLEFGYSHFIQFDYQIDFDFSFEAAYEVSQLILMGSTLMMYTFMFVYKPPVYKLKDSNRYLADFIESRKIFIFIGLSVFSLFTIIFSGSISEGYGNLSKLGNSSFILLLFLLYHFTKAKAILIKLMYLVIFIFLARITYSSEIRFQFLGWMIPLGYFIVRNIKPGFKLSLMLVGMFAILIIFSAARLMRYASTDTKSIEELYEDSYDRIEEADDVNFIDGFIMMYQVYPRYLDHTMGMEHLNILLRPIPRNLWPDKPLAGWFQVYQAKYGLQQIRIGFSPTIYGVFYAEAGVAGIAILSIVWAFFLARMYRLYSAFQSDLSFLLIGILLTCLIPIFRSGDMAGDFAIVLLSYWPIMVLVRQYRKYVEKRLRYEKL